MSKETSKYYYPGLNVNSYKSKNIHPLMSLLGQEFPNWSTNKISSYMNLALSKQNDSGGILVAQNEASYYVGILIYTFQQIDLGILENTKNEKKVNIIIIENLIASSPVLQKEVFMALIDHSMKVGNLHSCEYIELPNFENGNLKLIELKYSGKIKKEGFRTYIKLKNFK
jgi:hypothetical protein